MSDLMYQCSLTKNLSDGSVEIVLGWIEEKGAKLGALVQMKEFDDEFYTVREVFHPPMSKQWVSENNTKAHKGTRHFSDI